MGWILTPSSAWATVGSSDSLCSRTFLPHRVLTKVVLPVPEAPHTIRQNWIPFLTFFFLRVLIAWEFVSSCSNGARGQLEVECRGRAMGPSVLGAGVQKTCRRLMLYTVLGGENCSRTRQVNWRWNGGGQLCERGGDVAECRRGNLGERWLQLPAQCKGAR